MNATVTDITVTNASTVTDATTVSAPA